jgi:hypothetical protein
VVWSRSPIIPAAFDHFAAPNRSGAPTKAFIPRK